MDELKNMKLVEVMQRLKKLAHDFFWCFDYISNLLGLMTH